jgi:hypothetical protein
MVCTTGSKDVPGERKPLKSGGGGGGDTLNSFTEYRS